MFSRIYIYLKEMFPLPSFIGGFISALAIPLLALKLEGIAITWSWLILPALAVVLFSLIIRISDEFKDFEDDLINYPNRPLPSGRVKRSDLKFLAFFVVFLSFIFSLSSIYSLCAALAVYAYSFLMLKWFFVEKPIRASITKALVTHHPIVFFHFLYMFYTIKGYLPDYQITHSFQVLPIALMFTNWEISRKIKSPADENTYTTYSKSWGPKLAITICLFLQMSLIATFMHIFIKLNVSLWAQTVFYCIALILSIPFWQFLLKLKTPYSLRSTSESQILFYMASVLVFTFVNF